MSDLEYLYWHEGDELKHHVGNYDQTCATCRSSGAEVHYCYGTGYQFESPWYTLSHKYDVQGVLPPSAVPHDIRALHLLIYRGDHE